MTTFGFVNMGSDFFTDSLIPELVGVCIELLIILIIFDFWQRSEEKKKLESIERRLREILNFFMTSNFISYSPESRPIGFYGVNFNDNQIKLDELVKTIEKKSITEDDQNTIIEYCSRELSVVSNLLPVAAELTNDHFKAWVRVVYYMNVLSREYKSDISDSEQIKEATIHILKNIKRFDKASHDSNVYVGAN
ncbi:hypothetical protein BCT69_04780 [Enterovibrio norvegicus]|nr:hypothetical protein BCT69_04780 [Enterovibrio norvegicus]